MTREEAIKWIDDRMCWGRGTFTKHHPPNIDECWQAGLMAIEALKAEPVRCKDCKHIGIIDEDEGTLYYHCCFWTRETDGWGFCYKAERREP